MLLDLGGLDDGAVLDADLAVVGAGAAGIAIARELAGTRWRVVVAESGGLGFEPETQALYRGENAGLPGVALESSRLRQLGGSTQHWHGWCAPLAPCDCEERAWLPHSGWPLTHASLAPWYARARPVLGLREAPFDASAWSWLDVEPLLPGDAGDEDDAAVRASFWQIREPPLRFGDAFRGELERAPNVRVLLHANAVAFDTHAGGTRVERVELRSLTGRRAALRARAFVLACGGLENPRLLLASDAADPRGLGNRHDLVGRCFMDHYQVHFARVASPELGELAARLGLQRARGALLRPALALTPAAQRRHRVAHVAAAFDATDWHTPGAQAAWQILRGFEQGYVVDDFGRKLWRVLRELAGPHAGSLAGLERGRRPEAVRALELRCFGEQAPDPESRVTLGPERDALGMRRIRLDWRLGELERRSLVTLATELGAELAQHDLGRVQLAEWLRDPAGGWPDALKGGCHHMGTTRMANEPRHGVVDRDCRVHGVENLFVAGSSVFPTSGWANPTYTIVALALRLADHLRRWLPRAPGTRHA